MKLATPKRARNKSRYAVLGMLGMGLETGYQMKKHVEGNLGHFWTESYGQIYPILAQLLEEGLVTRRSVVADGKPRRDVYKLTAAGRRELLDWLRLPPEKQPPRSELLLKLSFGARNHAPTMIDHLHRYRAACDEDLAMLGEIEVALRDGREIHPDQPYWLMTLRYGQAIRAAERQWCERTIRELQAHGAEGHAPAKPTKRRASR
jgi:PadR family transcriptional regulator, regulatory protein AphA